MYYRIDTCSKALHCVTYHKKFSQVKRFKTHEKNLTGTITLKYINCHKQKTFSHASTLETRKVPRNGVKDLCIIYQKTFSCTITLKTHEVTQNGVKYYKWIPYQNTFS